MAAGSIIHKQFGSNKAPHKYGAVRTVVDGVSFPSKAEANRWMQLRLLQSIGEAREIELQPRFDLIVNGVSCGFYKADFRYQRRETPTSDIWLEVVEDVKGPRHEYHRESTLKRKLVKALHGVDVILVNANGGVIEKKKGRRRVNAKPARSTT